MNRNSKENKFATTHSLVYSDDGGAPGGNTTADAR